MFKFRIDVLKRVERNREIGVGRVNQHHVFQPVFRNKIQNIGNDIAMGVNKTKPEAVSNVLAH